MNASDSEYFKNRKEAHTWLQDNGYKISIGKFYEDIKQKGFPVLRNDGTVSKYQVAVYGNNLNKELEADPSALDRSEDAHRKEKAEARMAEIKLERMEREEDKLWLHADVAWSVLASLIGELRDMIRRDIHSAQVEIVQAAGGDVSRAPEVFEHIDQVVNRSFNSVAKKSIDIQWEGEE